MTIGQAKEWLVARGITRIPVPARNKWRVMPTVPPVVMMNDSGTVKIVPVEDYAPARKAIRGWL